MAERRTWYINVRLARQTDGQVSYSATHWSPPRKDWPDYVREEVEHLTDAMIVAVATDAGESK